MPDRDLVDRVAESTGLSPAVAARVVDDVVAWYAENVTDYVRRRHAQLQLHGVRNAEAFATIEQELGSRVFAAPELTVRQLRRMVYG